MIKIYSAPSSFLIYMLKNILQNSGIECSVKGEERGMAMGELPPTECWIELWLTDHQDSVRAMQIIREALDAEEPHGTVWNCAGCGEEIESQFTQCWNCGKVRIEANRG